MELKEPLCGSCIFIFVFIVNSCSLLIGNSDIAVEYIDNIEVSIIDTLKVSGNQYIEFVDASQDANQLLLYEWGSEEIILFDIGRRVERRIQIFGPNSDQPGTTFAAGAFIENDNSLLLCTERGFYKYDLRRDTLTKILNNTSENVRGHYKTMVPFGCDKNWILYGSNCFNPTSSSMEMNYYSLEYMKSIRYLGLLNLEKGFSSCMIGLDPRSIQLTADDAHRFFPDGAFFFSEYDNNKLLFATNADNRIFIYENDLTTRPKMISYLLEYKYRPEMKTAPLGSVDVNLLNLRNGYLSSLNGTRAGEIILCYNKGEPEAAEDFVHDLSSLKRLCIYIDGTRSNEQLTYQSKEFVLPQGGAGFLTKLGDNNKYLMANDAVHNEQAGLSYIYIAELNKIK